MEIHTHTYTRTYAHVNEGAYYTIPIMYWHPSEIHMYMHLRYMYAYVFFQKLETRTFE